MNQKSTPTNKMTGVCTRGGVEIDESTLDDNATYWRMSANGATRRAEKHVGCTHELEDGCRVWKIQKKFWNHENTWRAICIKTERMRDLIRLLVKEKHDY